VHFSTKDDKTLVRLACSKNRLAPVKRVTLPRLELLAALVGTRLLHHFCTATDYNINQAILWSDATVALGWIRSDPNKWKTFATESRRYKHARIPRSEGIVRGWTTLLTISHGDSLATRYSTWIFGGTDRHGLHDLRRTSNPELSPRITRSPKRKRNQTKS